MDSSDDADGKDKEGKEKVPNVNFSPAAFSPFSSTKNSNVASGASAGIGDIFVGCACATGNYGHVCVHNDQLFHDSFN
jgi:hypothetical protein